MIQKDIEELATNAVKKSILTSRFLSQYISENDKEPSWDGFVYIYSREEKTKAAFGTQSSTELFLRTVIWPMQISGVPMYTRRSSRIASWAV